MQIHRKLLSVTKAIKLTGNLSGLNPKVKLKYQKGGYPPLTLSVYNKQLVITAKSDPSYFVKRGGCSISPKSYINEKYCSEKEDKLGKQVTNFNESIKLFNCDKLKL